LRSESWKSITIDFFIGHSIIWSKYFGRTWLWELERGKQSEIEERKSGEIGSYFGWPLSLQFHEQTTVWIIYDKSSYLILLHTIKQFNGIIWIESIIHLFTNFSEF
jgi:hypothetical protein